MVTNILCCNILYLMTCSTVVLKVWLHRHGLVFNNLAVLIIDTTISLMTATEDLVMTTNAIFL